MNKSDFIGPCCDCGACRQASVSDQNLRRDPRSGVWLHGYDLRRWIEARDQFLSSAREAVGAKGRHANGFEKLVKP